MKGTKNRRTITGFIHRWVFYRILIVACLFGAVEAAARTEERRQGTASPRLHAATAKQPVPALPPRNEAEPFHLLVFSKTAGYRHPSIADGQELLRDLAAANNFTVEFSEDATLFTDTGLAPFAGVLFLNTTGDILNATQEAAFERFIQAGKGFIGVHSATDTEYDWAWYGGLVGAYFADHPAIQEADVLIADAAHPSTVDLPNPWPRRDEWYNFQTHPTGVNVLLQVDEATYNGGTMGENHPISWYHIYDGGRAWYTAMGHTSASFEEPEFQHHLLGGILWAVNADGLSATPTPTPSNTPTATSTPTVTPTPTPFAVTGLTLLNAETDTEIRRLAPDDTLNLADLPTDQLTIRAETEPAGVGSVRFQLNDNPYYRIEHIPPYALAGDIRGDYLPWVPAPGEYMLVAEPFSGTFLTGTAGQPLTVTLRITDAQPAAEDDGGTTARRGTQGAAPRGDTPATANLNGVLYLDSNGNRRADPDEAPLDGIQLTVTPLEPITTPAWVEIETAVDGSFSLTNLAVGTYQITPDLPADLIALNPAAGAVPLRADSSVEVPDFTIFARRDVHRIFMPVVLR